MYGWLIHLMVKVGIFDAPIFQFIDKIYTLDCVHIITPNKNDPDCTGAPYNYFCTEHYPTAAIYIQTYDDLAQWRSIRYKDVHVQKCVIDDKNETIFIEKTDSHISLEDLSIVRYFAKVAIHRAAISQYNLSKISKFEKINNYISK